MRGLVFVENAPQLLFIDTEFTGLNQRWPRLISIGLVSEDGRHSFYAELPPESYTEKLTPWVQSNVLPLLNGGDCVMQPDALRLRLAAWLGALGAVRIVTNAPSFDFSFLRATLSTWPSSVNTVPIRFDTHILGSAHQELLEAHLNGYFSTEKPQHHALHDANALRRAWVKAKSLDSFQAFATKQGLRS